MASSTAPGTAAATIAAMVTPALLIVASASLVATVLVRMARVVDRARVLSASAHDGSWQRLGVSREVLLAWLNRHALRARYAERSIALLYAAVFVFIATCLSLAIGRLLGEEFAWLSTALATLGSCALLAGSAWMVAESRLAGEQIRDEIRGACKVLEEKQP